VRPEQPLAGGRRQRQHGVIGVENRAVREFHGGQARVPVEQSNRARGCEDPAAVFDDEPLRRIGKLCAEVRARDQQVGIRLAVREGIDEHAAKNRGRGFMHPRVQGGEAQWLPKPGNELGGLTVPAKKVGDAAIGNIRCKRAQRQTQSKRLHFLGYRQTARGQQPGQQMQRRREARQAQAEFFARRRPHPQFERSPVEHAFLGDSEHVEQPKQFTIGADDQMLTVVTAPLSLAHAPGAAAEFGRCLDQGDGKPVAREFDGGGEPRPAASDDDIHVARAAFCSRR